MGLAEDLKALQELRNKGELSESEYATARDAARHSVRFVLSFVPPFFESDVGVEANATTKNGETPQTDSHRGQGDKSEIPPSLVDESVIFGFIEKHVPQAPHRSR